ncbi:MAG TPA: hypothetical protein VGH28_04750 [Polyangiaceae bacterium]|jgi:hypothetical protein
MSIRNVGEAAPQIAPQPAPKAVHAVPVEKAAPGERSPFQKLLEGLGNEINHGERTVRGALHAGGDMQPSDLLALQAGVYRYSEAVDLASKLVDKASSGVKTVINGGGQ